MMMYTCNRIANQLDNTPLSRNLHASRLSQYPFAETQDQVQEASRQRSAAATAHQRRRRTRTVTRAHRPTIRISRPSSIRRNMIETREARALRPSRRSVWVHVWPRETVLRTLQLSSVFARIRNEHAHAGYVTTTLVVATLSRLPCGGLCTLSLCGPP